MKTLVSLFTFFLCTPQLAAGAFALQKCKRISASGSLVPIANCATGNISYNNFGVRILPKDPAPEALTLLFFASGEMASDNQNIPRTAAEILHVRLEHLLKKPIRIIDASYESYFTGESNLDLNRLLSEYKPHLTLVAFQNGVPVLKTIEMSLLDGQNFGLWQKDPERMLRMAFYSRGLAYKVFPKEHFLKPYFEELKKLDALSNQHGSQFRFLWNGVGVHPKTWFYWRSETHDWMKFLIQPLLVPFRVNGAEFEQALGKFGIHYRWAPSTGGEPTESFATAIANALFTREDWSTK